MDIEELTAGINVLVQQMESEPDDLHEIHFKLREMLNEIKATGMPLPADLVELDKTLGEIEAGKKPGE
jgi:hypothetical protein